MVIKIKKRTFRKPGEPILHENHKRPVTRREFLGAGLATGGAFVMADSLLMGMLSKPAYAATEASCGINVNGAGRIPFIAFDLSGGANIAGSNVLVGGPGGQLDLLSTAGYNKLGLPGDMIPGATEATPTATSNGDHTDSSFGLMFHSDSAFLRGMLAVTSPTTRAFTNGCVIPARSDNDTSNNPHNPMYLINMCGAKGALLELVGSSTSVSGGNSMAPADSINLKYQPTKVSQNTDVTGLIDTGDIGKIFPDATQAAAVMKTVEVLSAAKMNINANAGNGDIVTTSDIKEATHCAYLKTTSNVASFNDQSKLDYTQDTNVTNILNGSAGITVDGLNADFGQGYYKKVASVMKVVIDGYASAGTIQNGGYDYHTGDRATGELRDLQAGIGIGMCLEYAAAVGKPVMIYVFSDGSLASNGRVDDTVNGRGKCEWTGDNSSTAASFFLVYDPRAQVTERVTGMRQLGYMSSGASVQTSGTTPGANNPNLLAQMVMLNYLALHGESDNFANCLIGNSNPYLTALNNGIAPTDDPRMVANGLGSSPTQWNQWIAFNQISSLTPSGNTFFNYNKIDPTK